MLLAHGAALLAWRTDGAVAARARRTGAWLALATGVLFGLGGFWVAALDGHAIAGAVDTAAASNPALKTVELVSGGWLHNFARWPLMWAAPVLGVAASLLAAVLLWRGAKVAAFLSTSAAIAGIILSVGFALFPFLMPSSLQPDMGLTVWDASSSHLTLWVMLLATALLLPIVLSYTAWVYRVMRGTVTTASVSGNPHAY